MKLETNIKILKFSIICFFNTIAAIALIELNGNNFILTLIFYVNFYLFSLLFFIFGIGPRANTFLHPNHEESMKNPGYAALCSLGLYIKTSCKG